MPYFFVQDFKGGLDRRRLPVMAPPGTLRKLRNAHVTRGGEVEKRKAFVAWGLLPPGTLGLAGAAGRLYVFGSFADAISAPAGVTYQRLQAPSGADLARIRSAEPFRGKIYVIAEFSDGSVHHFYDGVRVTNFTNRTDAEKARVALVHKDNVYAASGSVLYRSGTGAPTDWSDSAAGSAFFDMSTQAAGSDEIIGLGDYLNSVAVFSRRAVQIWSFSADPDASFRQQVLRNIGTVAPNSVVSFADSDVFFLADSGIRSLRARDSSNTAASNDVGTAIDDDVVEALRNATDAQRERAHAAIEPRDGRYWLALGSTIYVFSYYPASKVSAWSTYDALARQTDMVAVDNRLYIRAGDTIYLYGGTDGNTYDSTQAEVELAYLDGRQIATWKNWHGLDIAAEGAWDVYAAFDPEQPDAEDLIGRLEGPTFHQLSEALLGAGPMVKLRLVSVGDGPARLGGLAVHYSLGNAS